MTKKVLLGADNGEMQNSHLVRKERPQIFYLFARIGNKACNFSAIQKTSKCSTKKKTNQNGTFAKCGFSVNENGGIFEQEKAHNPNEKIKSKRNI